MKKVGEGTTAWQTLVLRYQGVLPVFGLVVCTKVDPDTTQRSNYNPMPPGPPQQWVHLRDDGVEYGWCSRAPLLTIA